MVTNKTNLTFLIGKLNDAVKKLQNACLKHYVGTNGTFYRRDWSDEATHTEIVNYRDTTGT